MAAVLLPLSDFPNDTYWLFCIFLYLRIITILFLCLIYICNHKTQVICLSWLEPGRGVWCLLLPLSDAWFLPGGVLNFRSFSTTANPSIWVSLVGPESFLAIFFHIMIATLVLTPVYFHALCFHSLSSIGDHTITLKNKTKQDKLYNNVRT